MILKTTVEKRIKYNWILLIIYVCFISCCTFIKTTENIKRIIVISFVIFMIVEIIIMMSWLPDYVKKRCAFKRGKRIEGEIIKSMAVENYGISKRKIPYIFILKIKIRIQAEEKILEFGKFVDYPDDYFENHKAIVYYYKDKFYLEKAYRKRIMKEYQPGRFRQILYGEYDDKDIHSSMKYHMEELSDLSNTEQRGLFEEWGEFAWVKSQDTWILSPVMIMTGIIRDNRPLVEIFIEIRGKSKEKESGFTIEQELNIHKYLNNLYIKYDYNESLVLEEMIGYIQYMIPKAISIEQIHVAILKEKRISYYPYLELNQK